MKKNMTANLQIKGIIISVLSGLSFAVGGVASKYLLLNYDISPVLVASIRMGVAGTCLVLISLFRGKYPDLKRLFSEKKHILALFIYGVFGLMMGQVSFIFAIDYTNTATASVLQKINLIILVFVVCIKEKRFLRKKELLALFLALFGVFLLATGGNIHNLVLSTKGLFCGLICATGAAVYTLAPRDLFKNYDRITVVGAGMFLGAFVLILGARSWTYEFNLDYKGVIALGLLIFFATILSFTLYSVGVSLIGPVKTSMINVVDPVMATIFSVVLNLAVFAITDYIAFVAILFNVFLLAKPDDNGQKMKGSV